MTTEVQVPNPDGALMPGMYVQAVLTFPVPHRVVEIPSTALYNDAQGLRVGVVDAQQKLHFVPITIERDTGPSLQIERSGRSKYLVASRAYSTAEMTLTSMVPAAISWLRAVGTPSTSSAFIGMMPRSIAP
jgi:multidrug efflux pump subunit AcrA (membrane-fusion protein)